MGNLLHRIDLTLRLHADRVLGYDWTRAWRRAGEL
jgi:hypothetical protein